jgi:hypothetical protein
VFGGFTSPPGANTAATEEYDGSTWTAGGNLVSSIYALSGCGLQTAALAFGGNTGSVTGLTQTYDGSSWTSVPPMSTARQLLGGAGTQTTGLAFGGTTALQQTQQNEEFSGPQTTATASTLTTS